MSIFLFYALVGVSSYSDFWMTLRLELSDKMNTFIFFWRRKPFSGDSSHSLTSRPSTVSKQKKNEILDPQEMNATSTGAQFVNISHKKSIILKSVSITIDFKLFRKEATF